MINNNHSTVTKTSLDTSLYYGYQMLPVTYYGTTTPRPGINICRSYKHLSHSPMKFLREFSVPVQSIL